MIEFIDCTHIWADRPFSPLAPGERVFIDPRNIFKINLGDGKSMTVAPPIDQILYRVQAHEGNHIKMWAEDDGTLAAGKGPPSDDDS